MKDKILPLIRRDMRRAVNIRTFLIWAALSAMCIFFFFTSNGKQKFLETGEIEYMTLFLPLIIFGAWAVLSVYFDLISSEREHNVLDCILCSGVSKLQVFFSKLVTTVMLSLILSILYLLPVTGVIISLGESMAYIRIFLKYLFPLWGFIMLFAAWGIFLSVLARSSKSALIWSLASGLILMPRFFIMLVDGLGGIFHWTQSIRDRISMIAPGIMLQALADVTDRKGFTTALCYFVLGILFLFTGAYFTFRRQDEYNYGE